MILGYQLLFLGTRCQIRQPNSRFELVFRCHVCAVDSQKCDTNGLRARGEDDDAYPYYALRREKSLVRKRSNRPGTHGACALLCHRASRHSQERRNQGLKEKVDKAVRRKLRLVWTIGASSHTFLSIDTPKADGIEH
ncbi:hypothetical protein BT96DRAFT_195219 [Gymnopus androsaceus JB14]|uniref:Uncharacterized protein n=1 Tax=Gymnopus androsaceus JB14 TaxID=1447944 RepID=A0A6A4H953_9AGAR|nr:hypothetical protein BT96DRAFT_195219 [Gymnopus androsaceus JB14]